MADKVVEINRAPVLTLWAAVVAERLGFDWPTALTLGKTVAGLNAQSKGRALGIYTPREAQERSTEAAEDETFRIELLQRAVPCLNTDDGIRAVTKGKPVDPAKVETYLTKRFGDSLDEVRAAMTELAESWDDELEREAFGIYEAFRPEVASGQTGWGQKGELKIERIRELRNAGT